MKSAADASHSRLSPDAVRRVSAPELWHRQGTLCLGCTTCTERSLCGGLSVEAGIHSCMDLCCGRPAECRRYACPMKPEQFRDLVNELEGLDLQPFSARVRQPRQLPSYVPFILDPSAFCGPLDLGTVALPLLRVVDLATGLAKFGSREELCSFYRIRADTRLILFGTDTDNRVERFHVRFKRRATADSIRALRPDLVVPPNFSMHCDAPRHDNLVSMKRISDTFASLALAGLPSALHVNGRVPRDFERWSEYLRRSLQVKIIAYEFGTLGRSSVRAAWHVEQLVKLASVVGRPLVLLIRGGARFLGELRRAYAHVVLLDTSAVMKTRHRQASTRDGSRVRWHSAPTPEGAPLDELLLQNVRVCGAAIGQHVREVAHTSGIQVSKPVRPLGAGGRDRTDTP